MKYVRSTLRVEIDNYGLLLSLLVFDTLDAYQVRHGDTRRISGEARNCNLRYVLVHCVICVLVAKENYICSVSTVIILRVTRVYLSYQT